MKRKKRKKERKATTKSLKNIPTFAKKEWNVIGAVGDTKRIHLDVVVHFPESLLGFVSRIHPQLHSIRIVRMSKKMRRRSKQTVREK
jgi:hypothetical protein